MDIVFVDFPVESPKASPTWSLGYRSMIASLRENGFSSTILHPLQIEISESRRQLIKEILKINTQIIGFTAYDVYLEPLIEFVQSLRRAGSKSHVTIGGICASTIAEELLTSCPQIDSVIIGEGELSIVDLCKMILGKKTIPPKGILSRIGKQIVSGGIRSLVENLNQLPSPVLDNFVNKSKDVLADYQMDNMLFVSSRGCYGKCTFCCVQRFYRSCPGQVWRPRSPERVVNEISECKKSINFHRFTFVDENFIGPGHLGQLHAQEIARELKKQQINLPFNFGCRPNDLFKDTLIELKSAGLTAVTLGLESMSNETLRLFSKGTTVSINEEAIKLLEQLELYLEITFIFFHPLSSIAEINKNLKFIRRIRQSRYAYFNKNMPFTEFIPLFDTEYTKHLEKLKLVEKKISGFTIHYSDPRVEVLVQKMRSIPLEQLDRFIHQLQTNDLILKRTLQSLLDYETNLNLVRLPELVTEYCDLFSSGFPDNKQLEMVLQEFDHEAEKIQSLFTLVVEVKEN
jgi:anaerobic magnesium-protoporphyrin IX monomethyl ester cyclase